MNERLTRDELRTLFLFESLTDDQLDWITARGYVLTFDGPSEVCTEGDPGSHFGRRDPREYRAEPAAPSAATRLGPDSVFATCLGYGASFGR